MTDKNLAQQLENVRFVFEELEEKIVEELVRIYSLVKDNHPMEHQTLLVLNDYEMKARRAVRRLFKEAISE